MDLSSNNDALPNHPVWRNLLDNWELKVSKSTLRRFALPLDIPRVVNTYLVNAHSVGKCSTKNSTSVDFEELYPPSVTDIQARSIEEAVCLG